MKFQHQVSLLSIVAATLLSSASFVQAEPITHALQSLQQAGPEAIETINWVERHGCSGDYKVGDTVGDNVDCDPQSAVSPVMPATVQDDLRVALTDLFAVRFGFGPAQPFESTAGAKVDWDSVIRAEFDRVATQSGWAAQVHRHQNGFNF